MFPLSGVEAIGSEETARGATPEAGASPAANEAASAMDTSFTLVDASLDNVVDGDHAINVHESEENIGDYTACGDIGGTITPDPASGEGRQCETGHASTPQGDPVPDRTRPTRGGTIIRPPPDEV